MDGPKVFNGSIDSYTDYTFNYSYSYGVEFPSPEEDEGLQIAGTVTAVFYSLIVFVSLTGNSFLLWVLVKHRGLGSSANLLLLHLTVSDLIFILTLVPWAIYHVWGWVFGELACRLFSGTIFLGLYSYMMFLTCMTVHRYMAVVHALRTSLLDAHSGTFYTHLTCTIVWVLSASGSLYEVLLSKTENGPDGLSCILAVESVKVELIANYLQISVFFLIPFLIITFCYSQILMTILRCQMRNREHTVWLILCIVIGFFICWAPYNITLFLHSLGMQLGMATFSWKKGLAYSYYITHIMAYCHCCLNPLIQIFGGVRFRRYLRLSSGFSYLSERETPAAGQAMTGV
ncbi:chemokine XC receptor 1 [Salminus brasiliensis]|uniref:chemokine XC receptor 1 n=1 Tax=Salminus brasiliensis TaxID=930266 RepID=UPI003B833598